MVDATILLVGHGSRGAGGNQEVEKFTEQWRQCHQDRRIELCFIELAEILLPEGLDKAARNSQRVRVVPFILNAAGHVKMEVPAAVAEARLRHPKVTFEVASHLGVCEPLLKVTRRSLHRAMVALDLPDPKTTGVVLLARGSSDTAANGEMARMARWLFEETDHELVELAFTGITWPRLESTVQRLQRLGMTQVAIVPYYLFTGTLMQRIERQVERLRGQYPQLGIAQAAHFGFEPEIFALLDQRIADTGGSSMLACDGCSYREAATEASGHHRHHETKRCGHAH
uniref:Sirohydrochlorin cobaltochelatase n=1 Tax=Candidatus Kentrum sp. TUN TaxID=2126343 RepID=A0A450ZND6_9GAMM|nr:MAG: sirohydrochlorin cobaltochelatase [Candidatus Kentron sp. TUN]VFK54089.1 MAG: sirohydrochlorin cobaltochelatase [Candidatus Kentron sp. TUN]VFK55282.1 MAG: sirohydrochlorin cobaltochelatase [Candidatus Kentron sp. TUN]